MLQKHRNRIGDESGSGRNSEVVVAYQL